MASINLIGFIKQNIPDYQREVYILEEIKNYKRIHNKDPVIFFDLFNILYLFDECDKRELFCGYRMNVLNKKIVKFFEQLKNVEIIFFHKNHTYIAYNPEDRKLKTEANFIFKATQEFYEFHERRRPIDNFNPEREEAFNIRRLFITNHFPQFLKYGKIHAINQYSEIAQLAKQKNALAIVSIYSEFLIYGADWKNWSLYDLDVNSLKTMELKKHGGLKEFFNLNTQQFNLFWMLKKNVVMVLQDHDSHISYLAEYVQQFENPLTDEDYGQIADEILSNCHRPKKQRYFLKDDMNRLMEMENEHHGDQEEEVKTKTLESELAKFDILSYNIFKRFPINLPRLMVNTLHCDAPPFFTYWGMLNDIISKKVGIIFHDCGVRTFQYTTVVRKTQDEHYVVENKIAKFPPVSLPDLLELMDPSKTMHEDTRYQLLSWMVFNNKNFSEFLMKQKKKFLIESLTIKYLLRFKQLDTVEADVLLLSLDSPADEIDLPKPLYINPRAAHVAFTFIQMYFQLKTFLSVLGLTKFFDYPLEFDGLFFHENYSRLNDRSFNLEQQFRQKSHLKCFRDITNF